MIRRTHSLLFFLIALVALMSIGLTPASAATTTATTVSNITFIGEDQLYASYQLIDAVGGFSGITYTQFPLIMSNAEREWIYGWRDAYFLVSSDHSHANPPYIYEASIQLDDGQLYWGDVSVWQRKELLDTNGNPLDPQGFTPEGIAMIADNNVMVTAEDAFRIQNPALSPYVSQFSIANGQISTARQTGIVEVPYNFMPITHGGASGMRNNAGLESAAITPDKSILFTATANAMGLDGPAASLTERSPSRILRYDLASDIVTGEFVYEVEKVADPPISADGIAVNSLVDFVALNNTTLLSLERSFSTGVGYRVKLYLVSLSGATDVTNVYSFIPVNETVEPAVYTPVQKTLLLDLDTLGIPITNIEGMTLGPILPNGQRALILVSDNTMSKTQYTQFLAFGITITQPPFTTTRKAYIKPVATGVSVTPLLTVGDEIPQTGDLERRYRMTGIPDGLGVSKAADGTVSLYLNHEFSTTSFSIPVPGEQSQGYSIPEGLLRGAYVSRLTLAGDALPALVSGDLAFTQVQEYNGDTGDFADRTIDWLYFNRPFSRFCSGSLAGPQNGFAEPIYLTGEETDPATSFDGLGGVGVAIVDGVAYTLPELGHFAKENLMVLPGTGAQTVVLITKDGSDLDSQLFMYVGTKNPTADSPVKRAGLVGGDLYVFGATNPSRNSEAMVRKADGTIAGQWIKVQDVLAPGEQVWTLSDSILNSRIKAAGAYGFVRIKDVTYDRTMPGTIYLATTGSTFALNGVVVNKLGRITRMTLDPANPTGGTTSLTVLLEGDAGDPIVNPDNLAMNANGILAINEDPNSENRGAGLLDERGRDASVWAYDVPGDHQGSDGALVRIAEIDQTAIPDLPGYRAERGNWETSGIIDVSDIYGPGAWLVVVQAHSLNSSEASALAGSSSDLKLVEGGQLVLLRTP